DDLDRADAAAVTPHHRRATQKSPFSTRFGGFNVCSAVVGGRPGILVTEMKPQLVFDAPRRALKPPRHLADLDAAGRAAAVAELGLPAFRGKQLAQQYYGRLIADPQQMTDLP